jgi:hypothetical protein
MTNEEWEHIKNTVYGDLYPTKLIKDLTLDEVEEELKQPSSEIKGLIESFLVNAETDNKA